MLDNRVDLVPLLNSGASRSQIQSMHAHAVDRDRVDAHGPDQVYRRRCQHCCVGLLDVLLIILFVVPILATFFFFGWLWLLYFVLLVAMTIVLVPFALCVDDPPSAERLLEPYRFVVSRPHYYLWKWHTSAREYVREHVLDHDDRGARDVDRDRDPRLAPVAA